jgi:hypothetical protein
MRHDPDKNRKQSIRARMNETGEPYNVARRHLEDQADTPGPLTGTCGVCDTAQPLRNGTTTLIMHRRELTLEDEFYVYWCEGSARHPKPDAQLGADDA